MTTFHQILGNTLVASITNFTIWFALTFWVYLETASVFATGTIGGIYLISIAATGVWFGSIVDHHRKRTVMLLSSAGSLVFYAAGLALHEWAGHDALRDLERPHIWIFIVLVMSGVLAGNLRTIALPTLVTLLVPDDRRDKANGLVGMTTGIGFLTTSVISGFLVAWGGMRYTLLFGMGLTVLAIAHLCSCASTATAWRRTPIHTNASPSTSQARSRSSGASTASSRSFCSQPSTTSSAASSWR